MIQTLINSGFPDRVRGSESDGMVEMMLVLWRVMLLDAAVLCYAVLCLGRTVGCLTTA